MGKEELVGGPGTISQLSASAAKEFAKAMDVFHINAQESLHTSEPKPKASAVIARITQKPNVLGG